MRSTENAYRASASRWGWVIQLLLAAASVTWWLLCCTAWLFYALIRVFLGGLTALARL